MTTQTKTPKTGTKATAGRIGRTKSPWNRGPMCDTKRALGSYKAYKAEGKRNG